MSDNIFDISESGWCDFHFGEINVPSISYICDPHLDLIEALSLVLAEGTSSTITFDHEGTESILLVSQYGLTFVNDNGCVHEPFEYTGAALTAFSAQLADELERDIDKWVSAWRGYDDTEEAQQYKELMEDMIDGLRKAISAHTSIMSGDYSAREVKTFRNSGDVLPAKARYLV